MSVFGLYHIFRIIYDVVYCFGCNLVESVFLKAPNSVYMPDYTSSQAKTLNTFKKKSKTLQNIRNYMKTSHSRSNNIKENLSIHIVKKYRVLLSSVGLFNSLLLSILH